MLLVNEFKHFAKHVKMKPFNVLKKTPRGDCLAGFVFLGLPEGKSLREAGSKMSSDTLVLVGGLTVITVS